MFRRVLFAFGVWLCVYPLVTGLMLTPRATRSGLPLPAQTMVVTALLVPTMMFGLVPLIRRLNGIKA